MISPTHQPTMEEKLNEAQLRKLNAEIQAMEWQNSWSGQIAKHLGTISILFTLVATIVGVSISVWNVIDSSRKDRELKEKELVEKFDTRYNSNLEQLVAFGKDSSLTVSLAILKLEQLEYLIKNFPQQSEDDRKKKRSNVTDKLNKLFNSESFDFERPNDLEFEMNVLDIWKEYSDYLQQDTKYHAYIIYKYLKAIRNLHNIEKPFVESATLEPDGSVLAKKPPQKPQNGSLYEKLTQGFKKHIGYLQARSNTDSKLLETFQSYCNAIKNPGFAKAVFGSDALYNHQPNGCN
jgi:hypothetical protein